MIARKADTRGTFAAADLGSNSFHLIVARVGEGGQLVIVDRLRERVRLGAGLDKDDELSEEAQDEALACLEQFGQRIRHLPKDQVRIVGTNALRKARNAGDFKKLARAVLGHRVDVISGREEARLIYQGVAHDFQDQGRRLLVDIGGGSTEVIIGEGFEPKLLESLYMGCISHSERYFPRGRIDRKGMSDAIDAASLELRPIKRQYRELGWQHAVGSSGTILQIERILVGEGYTRSGITLKELKRLKGEVIDAGRVQELELEGLKKERASVLPGGLAILIAVFEALRIEEMTVVESALREGVLYDLVGRRTKKDIREDSLRRFSEQFAIDRAHAARVEATALGLFDQVAKEWKLGDFPRQVLSWAARLHELGTFLSHASYHKHGAYLLRHADLPGFSRDEQQILAGLVLLHRGKLTESRRDEVGPVLTTSIVRTALLLRLAVRLHRSRDPEPLPPLQLEVDDDELDLTIGEKWLKDHSLTEADLDEEARAFKAAGFRLRAR